MWFCGAILLCSWSWSNVKAARLVCEGVRVSYHILVTMSVSRFSMKHRQLQNSHFNLQKVVEPFYVVVDYIKGPQYIYV